MMAPDSVWLLQEVRTGFKQCVDRHWRQDAAREHMPRSRPADAKFTRMVIQGDREIYKYDPDAPNQLAQSVDIKTMDIHSSHEGVAPIRIFQDTPQLQEIVIWHKWIPNWFYWGITGVCPQTVDTVRFRYSFHQKKSSHEHRKTLPPPPDQRFRIQRLEIDSRCVQPESLVQLLQHYVEPERVELVLRNVNKTQPKMNGMLTRLLGKVGKHPKSFSIEDRQVVEAALQNDLSAKVGRPINLAMVWEFTPILSKQVLSKKRARHGQGGNDGGQARGTGGVGGANGGGMHQQHQPEQDMMVVVEGGNGGGNDDDGGSITSSDGTYDYMSDEEEEEDSVVSNVL